MDIIKRKDAKKQGLTKYFTGNPCKRSHFSERYTVDRLLEQIDIDDE